MSNDAITLLKSVLNFYNADKRNWLKRMHFGSRALADEVDGGGPMPVSTPDEADCCCLRGALFKFSADGLKGAATLGAAARRLQAAIRELDQGTAYTYSPHTAIITFNDHQETDLKDVKKVLTRAIEMEAKT